MNSNELRILFELARNKGCKFTSLTYRTASTGELARHTLLFGVDYGNTLKRDLRFLKRAKSKLRGLDLQACEELIEGLEKSITKNSGPVDQDDVYEVIVPGVKRHKQTGVYYLWALTQGKVVLEPGKPSKPTNSKPLTVAKDGIRDRLRSDKYRQFRLDTISEARINGTALEIA